MNKLEKILEENHGLYTSYCVKNKEDKFSKVCSVKQSAEITTDVAVKFLEFEKSLKKENRGGEIMYDLKGHYKYLTIGELFQIFINSYYEK